MDKKPTKQVHNAIIRQRAADLAKRLTEVTEPGEQLGLIEKVLWETSLESWKNGIEAGSRKAQEKKAA